MTTVSLLAQIAPRGLFVGFFLPVLIVALVAYGVFELVRSRPPAIAQGAEPAWTPPGPSTPALSILDERFARGDIDAEEYVQRRTLLVPPGSPSGAPPVPPVVSPAAAPAPLESEHATTEQPVTDQPPAE